MARRRGRNERRSRANERSTSPQKTSKSCDENTISSVQDMEQVHGRVYELFHSGLDAVEINDSQNAMRYFSEGLKLINAVMRVNCQKLYYYSSDEIDKAKQMQKEMASLKKLFAIKIQFLQFEKKINKDRQIQEAIVAGEKTAPYNKPRHVRRQEGMDPYTGICEGSITGEEMLPYEPRHGRRQEGMDQYTGISEGIVQAAGWISWGLCKGAEKASELLKAGSEKIRKETPRAFYGQEVDTTIKNGLYVARAASHASLQISDYLVTKFGDVAGAAAKSIGPHIKTTGEKYLPQSMTEADENGKSQLDGLLEVAGSGLQGFGTIYVGLETASKTLGRSLANETVNLVEHKYGAHARQAAEDSVYSAGNFALTALNFKRFGVKALAHQSAKGGQEHHFQPNQNRSFVP